VSAHPSGSTWPPATDRSCFRRRGSSIRVSAYWRRPHCSGGGDGYGPGRTGTVGCSGGRVGLGDKAGQPAPDYDLNQRINWWAGEVQIPATAGWCAFQPEPKSHVRRRADHSPAAGAQTIKARGPLKPQPSKRLASCAWVFYPYTRERWRTAFAGMNPCVLALQQFRLPTQQFGPQGCARKRGNGDAQHIPNAYKGHR